MFRRTFFFGARPKLPSKANVPSFLEALTQIQLGITPPLSVQRQFLLQHCAKQLEEKSITDAQLYAMDGKLCYQLLRSMVYEQYFSSVPFRVFAFDMEFTGPPVFTADGPTEDITEFGLYSPGRDEQFSCLVKPVCGRKLGPGVAELTHITDEMLEKEGLPFEEAWQKFLDFVNTPEPNELPNSDQRILLLSHGGKLADVSLIKWTLEKFELELPSSFVFGDTINIIRDAHRRRPVTVDKHPPSWKLADLVAWLKIPVLSAHRAGNDAKMTWDAIYHTLDRYGEDGLTPKEQLVSRFFDDDAKRFMRERQTMGRIQLGDSTASTEAMMNELDVDFDDIFTKPEKAETYLNSSASLSSSSLPPPESAQAMVEEFTLDDEDGDMDEGGNTTPKVEKKMSKTIAKDVSSSASASPTGNETKAKPKTKSSKAPKKKTSSTKNKASASASGDGVLSF